MRSIAHHLCTIGDRFYSVRCAALLSYRLYHTKFCRVEIGLGKCDRA
ncbi:hypothetical protein [Aerosakkonema funiforme]